MKIVRAKRHAKLKKNNNPPESMADNRSPAAELDRTVTDQVIKFNIISRNQTGLFDL